MITKEVKYENFDGVEVTETLHFHLSKQELTELTVIEPDLMKRLLDAFKTNNTSEIYKIFKKFVLSAYGVKADSNTFIKDESTKKFEYTLAFEAVMEEILKDTTSLFAFIKGVIPKNIADQLPPTPEMYTPEKTKELISELEQKVNA